MQHLNMTHALHFVMMKFLHCSVVLYFNHGLDCTVTLERFYCVLDVMTVSIMHKLKG